MAVVSPQLTQRFEATSALSATTFRVAALASAAAGLIHGAAAGSHATQRSLTVLFSLAAVLQLAWSFAAFTRPTASVRWAGIALNVGSVGFWMATRVAGFDAISGLETAQSVGWQDATAAVFATIAALSALAANTDAIGHTPNGRVVAAAATAAMLATLPVLSIRHAHTSAAAPGPAAAALGTPVALAGLPGAAGHVDDGHPHPDTATVPVSVSNASPASADAGASHGHAGGTAGAVYMTVAQKSAADSLIARTKVEMARFATTAAAAAAGYNAIGDALTGWEHWINLDLYNDGKSLDPSAPESLVYQVSRTDGSRTLASAMYILSTGTTMAQVPDTVGPTSLWHDHQNLCWDPTGKRLAGIMINGKCTGGEFRGTAPMLHVWVIPNVCNDPFAGVDTNAGVDCVHGSHHDTAASAPAKVALTLAQSAASTKLIADVELALKKFPTEDSVKAAGYTSIGDARTGFEHYVNVGYIANPNVLDPTQIESLVFKVRADGSKELQSAMFILPFGTTLADIPDTVGPASLWHDHQNLCWEGITVVGTTDATGSCVRGTFRQTAPMLHVWNYEHPCGRFAGIEGSHGTSCDHKE